MAATIELTDDPRAFAAQAQAFLELAPERTVLATVLDGVLAGRFADPPPHFALVRGAGGELIGAALRTSRWLLCSALGADDADALMTAWLTRDPRPPGVSADLSTAEALAAAWRRATGAEASLRTALALFAATEITDPLRPASGSLRRATAGELALLIEWWVAFARDAEVEGMPRELAEAGARAACEHGRAYLWEDGGLPVSLVAHNVPVAGVPRIGPVYTPPEHRRHGYAAGAVAQLSRRLLAGGAPSLLLFADVANVTATGIYTGTGYRHRTDWAEIAFG